MSSALLRKRSNSFNDLSISSKPIIVLKIGSASLSTLDGKFINLSIIVKVVETIASLRERGFDVILVTSGAVSIGCQKLNITERPKDLTVKQAIAAVGQCRLMRIYEDFFSHVNQPVAQVLLSRENLSQKHHYTNALNTFHALFKLGVVPIVNENDTVAVEELKFGDNDTLSALVASLVSADWLFLLTDVDALYSADPRSNPDAKPIRIVESIDDLKVDIGSAGNWGTGGMATKIQAARIGTAAGVRTGIIKSTRLQDINAIMKGEEAGTVFTCTKAPLKSQKRWIAHGLAPVGTLIIDDGAVNAIKNKKSLFAAGVVKVKGDFHSHSSVILEDKEGKEVGRGLMNYGAAEMDQIKGKSSKEFAEILGYNSSSEIIFRQNLVLTE